MKRALVTILMFSTVLVASSGFPLKACEDEPATSLMALFSRADAMVRATYNGSGAIPLSSGESGHIFHSQSVRKGTTADKIYATGQLNGKNAGDAGVSEIGKTWYLLLQSSLPNHPSNPQSTQVYQILYSTPSGTITADYLDKLASAKPPLATDPGVVSFLRTCLFSTDRVAMVLSLMELQETPVRQVLTTSDVKRLVWIVTEDQKYESGRMERFNALSLIVASGDLANPFVPALMTELDGLRGRFVTAQMAEILKTQPPYMVVNLLNETFKKKDPYTLINAADVARILGNKRSKAAVNFCDATLQANLVRGLSSPHTVVRQHHILALGEIGCPGADATLISYYPMADYEEKRRILYVLTRMGTAESKKFVEWAAVSESDQSAMKFASFILKNPSFPLFGE